MFEYHFDQSFKARTLQYRALQAPKHSYSALNLQPRSLYACLATLDYLKILCFSYLGYAELPVLEQLHHR